jgi:hypothetical protein
MLTWDSLFFSQYIYAQSSFKDSSYPLVATIDTILYTLPTAYPNKFVQHEVRKICTFFFQPVSELIDRTSCTAASSPTWSLLTFPDPLKMSYEQSILFSHS